MKFQKKPFVEKMHSFRRVGALLALLGTVVHGGAAIYTLNSGNSSADVDAGGLDTWVVSGVGQLNQSALYYRVGAGAEALLTGLSAPIVSSPLGNSVAVTYSNSSFNVKVSYTLSGGNPGNSGLVESITVKNTSGASATFSLFQYNDFDLGGVAGGQSVTFTQDTAPGPGNGQWYLAKQTGGPWAVTENVTHAAVPITHTEANTVGTTLTSLTDGASTILNDVHTAAGNVSFAYQWDMTIANGGSKIISKTLTIVPEPSSVTLISMGVIALGLIRRRAS